MGRRCGGRGFRRGGRGLAPLKLAIIAAGRLEKSAPERLLYDAYIKRFDGLGSRLGLGPVALHEIAARGAALERKALAAAVPAGAHRIALDPAGKPLTSEAFAGHLEKLRDAGARSVIFLIGGADGLGPLREAAEERLCFGPQTWPHLLVRVMLAEQLYRAASILAGHPYHRGA